MKAWKNERQQRIKYEKRSSTKLLKLRLKSLNNMEK